MKESKVIADFNGVPLFQNNKYSIELCDVLTHKTERKQLVVVIDELYTDWVMVYDNGTHAFTHPYTIPQYIKNKVRSLIKKNFSKLKEIETVSL